LSKDNRADMEEKKGKRTGMNRCIAGEVTFF